jgi:hypothetical protein
MSNKLHTAIRRVVIAEIEQFARAGERNIETQKAWDELEAITDELEKRLDQLYVAHGGESIYG